MEQFIMTSVPIAVAILTTAILYNVFTFEREATKAYLKSKVETGSMYGFAGLCYVAVWFSFGRYGHIMALELAGAVMVYISLFLNIYGRFVLKSNWSNQIRIRQGHQLIQRGPFRFVRHPLYATTIAMIYGAALCYDNGVVLILNTVFFVPMMIFRARQEEKELLTNVPGYKEYQSKVGMLLPKKFMNRSEK